MSDRNDRQQAGLRLYNTLKRRKQEFVPRRPGEVRMFTCGPSIYREPHIGNYRTFLYEDVLQRYLEYSGSHVERLLNFTDVEDKAVGEAQDKGLSREELTRPIEARFFEDAEALRIKLPSRIPRSSTSVHQAVELVCRLVEAGYAYWHDGDVFFDPLKFKGFGRLYGLDMSRWPKQKKRFRKDTYPGQRWNLGDFVLWHGANGRTTNGFTWQTRIGQGRPAWNIQDAAMITKHLGYNIDISCGGVDNLYRHHDYTIAIVESLSGTTFAPYWLHGEHVLADGVKMSKSRGNTVDFRALRQRGWSAAQIRFFLIEKHYRSKLDLTETALADAAVRLERMRAAAAGLNDKRLPVRSSGAAAKLAGALVSAFEERMNDDLDVAGACREVGEILSRLQFLHDARDVSRSDAAAVGKVLRRIDGVLQVLF